MPSTPWEVTESAQSGDLASFSLLYERYHSRVLGFVLVRTENRALAEDLTGDTFVKAFEHLPAVTDQGRDIGAWFTAIARNIIYDHDKHATRCYVTEHSVGILDEDDHPLVVSAEDAAFSRLGEVIARSDAVMVWRALGALSPDHRRCLVLRFIEGRSLAEVGLLMGRNVNAVKALQYRAMKAIREVVLR